MLDEVREEVAAACTRLAGEGLVIGTAGNVSARAGDHVAVTPTGGNQHDVTRFCRCTVTSYASGSQAMSRSKMRRSPSSFYERMGAGAVVHTHAPFATALSCVVGEVPAVHYQMLQVGGSLRVAPYATFGTTELAQNVEQALEGRSACLMQNHGMVAYGHDLAYAVESALLVEWACRLYWMASAIGTPSTLGEEQLEDVAAQVVRLGYGAKRSAG